MKVWVVAVGRPGRLIGRAIEEYEARAGRYWKLHVQTVRQESTRGRTEDEVRNREANRLLERLPDRAEIVALTRAGEAMDSLQLARYLTSLADSASPGAAFLIGGAYGLGERALEAAQRRLRLSKFTLPHDIARLALAEQLYRAGTIIRGEPYHKGGVVR